jgi:hypothetical protein
MREFVSFLFCSIFYFPFLSFLILSYPFFSFLFFYDKALLQGPSLELHKSNRLRRLVFREGAGLYIYPN